MPLPSTGPGRRVLIIEDFRDAADTLRLLLQLLGYDARVAYSGREGVRAANEWLPDAVLSDISMPGLDGYGVAAALRKNPATAQMLLVATTAYGSCEDRARSLAAGFDGHLTKPLNLDALQELLTHTN